MSLQANRVSSAPATRSELPDEHERLLRRLFERAYSKGELSALDDLVAADYIGYGTGPDVYRGPDGARSHVARLRSALFGAVVEVDEVQGDAGEFEVHWTARGRLERPFMGIDPPCVMGHAGEEPHGPTLSVTGTTTGSIADGRIREMRLPPGAG